MTMRLAVRHHTHFEYDTRVDYAVQRLLLTPHSFMSQKVESWLITAPGVDNALSYLDGFGNRVHLVTSTNVNGSFDVIAEGIVECSDAQGRVEGLNEMTPIAIYQRQTASTFPSPEMLQLCQSSEIAGLNGLELLHGLMRAIHQKVAYVIGVTDAYTTAVRAFENGAGVCQDHAHILLGITRSLGFSARYVTGYLVTGIGASSTAAHAWAEVLVPDLGWVGFDVANCICPTDQYVRVAAGIDAASVTPIRGSRRGGAAETMTVEVRVEIAQQ